MSENDRFDKDEAEEAEYEEAEEEDLFPDADTDEVGTEIEEFIPEVPEGKIPEFVKDPWPATTLLLTLIGFAIVLGTPYDIWYAQSYSLLGAYILMIVMSVGIMFSLESWYKLAGRRIRWGGLTNLVVISVSGVAGIADTLLWSFLGRPLIPGIETPIIGLASVIVVFCLYSLWLLRRTATQPQ